MEQPMTEETMTEAEADRVFGLAAASQQGFLMASDYVLLWGVDFAPRWFLQAMLRRADKVVSLIANEIAERTADREEDDEEEAPPNIDEPYFPGIVAPLGTDARKYLAKFGLAMPEDDDVPMGQFL